MIRLYKQKIKVLLLKLRKTKIKLLENTRHPDLQDVLETSNFEPSIKQEGCRLVVVQPKVAIACNLPKAFGEGNCQINFSNIILKGLKISLYGESSQFIRKIAKYNLGYVVSIRTNHGVWFPSGQSVRANKWCKFERTFSNQKSETRYIREIIYSKKRATTYWEITTDPETMPENSTSFVMTNLQGNLKKTLGDLYGLRTWVEYGFRQCKQELGWTDYRLTNFLYIERWGEIIFSVYTMISLNYPVFLGLNQSSQLETEAQENSDVYFFNHPQWNHESGWNNTLNNLRFIIQPLLLFWLIYPWLSIFPNSNLLLEFNHLIAAMNQFKPCYASG